MPPEPKFGARELNPGWADGEQAMMNVDWSEAAAFCAWAGGRLPTEAEWEYAARAGTTGVRYGGLNEVAWFGDNSGRDAIDSALVLKNQPDRYSDTLRRNGNGPMRVGLKRPNAWKLYDMLGNVWEWVSDWYDPRVYGKGEARDPRGPAERQYRVLRGGSWFYYPSLVRVSRRGRYVPGDRGNNAGLRCVWE